MFGILEIIIILGIIVFQLFLAYNLYGKIELYKSIYDFEDLPHIEQKNISLEVYETGEVDDMLGYEDEGDGVVTITYLDYENKSRVLATIVKYINVYLIKNKGATIDFHLIKDIVNTHTETVETQIENRIPAPLYLGLAATMVGIIVGLFSVNFSGDSAAALNAIQPLIDGVKWAMAASVIGLILTTIFSIKIYKDAQTEAEEEKSEFLSKLQSELMPKMATGNLPEVAILSDKLDVFARTTNNTVVQLDDIVRMSHSTIKHEQLLIKDIANLDVKGITSANVKVFNNLGEMMDSFKNFAKYYNKLDASMSSTTELLSNLKSFVKSTQNVNVVLEDLKNSVQQSNEATAFFNRHIQSFEKYNEAVNAAVASNDSAFREAVSELNKATLNQFDSFNTLISSLDSKLSDAFKHSVDKFTETMDAQVLRTEEAFENSRPKFEKLDKLDKLEVIDERLNNMESRLVSVISEGDKDSIHVLEGIREALVNIPALNKGGVVDMDGEKPSKYSLEFFLPYAKLTAYIVIIIFGIHTYLQYINILN